jgi:hypothetical protein
MRGNVADLAVAIIIGAAFGAVINAFADDFIGRPTPRRRPRRTRRGCSPRSAT